MSIGAAPNLSGGLWMAGTSSSTPSPGNGAANTGSESDCAKAGSRCNPDGGAGSGTVGGLNGAAGDIVGGIAGGGAFGGGSFGGSGYNDWGMGQWFGGDNYGPITVLGAGASPVGSPWPGCGCPPNPGGPTPPAVPVSGGPYSQYVAVVLGEVMVAGMVVCCTTSGVTLTSTCDGITFSHDSPGSFNYVLYAGIGEACGGYQPPAYYNGNSATVPNPPADSVNFNVGI